MGSQDLLKDALRQCAHDAAGLTDAQISLIRAHDWRRGAYATRKRDRERQGAGYVDRVYAAERAAREQAWRDPAGLTDQHLATLKACNPRFAARLAARRADCRAAERDGSGGPSADHLRQLLSNAATRRRIAAALSDAELRQELARR